MRSVRLDVRDPRDWESAPHTVAAELGPVDVLINNAGIIHTGTARSLSIAEHRDIISAAYVASLPGTEDCSPADPQRRCVNSGRLRSSVCAVAPTRPPNSGAIR